jgi:hypothetical protein
MTAAKGEVDQVVEAASCLDDLCSSRHSSCLTDVPHLPLDFVGTEPMTNEATPRQGARADNEHDDGTPWGEIDPFAQPRRQKTPGSGRRKGSLNKKTLQRRALMAAVRASGKDPLTFFTEILRNEDNPFELRFRAAAILLPHMHPKLASIEARSGGQTYEDRLAQYYQLLDDEGSNAGAPDALGQENDWMQPNGPEIAEVAPQTMLSTKF